MHRPSPLIVTLAAACLIAFSCGVSSERSDNETGQVQYAVDGTFTMALDFDPGSFDPYHSPISGLAYLAYDSLVNLRADGVFVSGLAEDWSVDPHTARFTLRPDVTCSDGTPLTASQVAAAINYVSDPANQSTLYGQNTPTVPMTATGDDATRTVTVVVERPFGFLLNTIGQLPIVCAKGLENFEILATASAGTGPFVLTDVAPGQSFTFDVREDYTWGPGGASTSAPGTPAEVVLQIVPNETTSANLLLSGEINLAKITGEDRQRLDAQGLDKYEVPLPGAVLWFNHLDGRPTADQAVRQALVHALELDEVTKVNTGGTGGAASGLIVIEPKPCTSDTVAGQLPDYDVAAAEALLDDAGWTTDADGVRSKDGTTLSLDLHYGTALSPYDKPTAELLADYWTAIGVQVDLTADSPTDFNHVWYETSDWDVYLAGGGWSLPSQAVSSLSGPVPPDGDNASGIDNADYNALVAKASAVTPPKACTYWNQAEQALFRDVDIAPIAYRPWLYYLHDAQARTAGVLPIPTSIRVLD